VEIGTCANGPEQERRIWRLEGKWGQSEGRGGLTDRLPQKLIRLGEKDRTYKGFEGQLRAGWSRHEGNFRTWRGKTGAEISGIRPQAEAAEEKSNLQGGDHRHAMILQKIGENQAQQKKKNTPTRG